MPLVNYFKSLFKSLKTVLDYFNSNYLNFSNLCHTGPNVRKESSWPVRFTKAEQKKALAAEALFADYLMATGARFSAQQGRVDCGHRKTTHCEYQSRDNCWCVANPWDKVQPLEERTF
ncbi:MAG TPA: hypothetical protein VH724_14560 [Candidatus Angelobacter sp.]|nr:hypothetical protein [Candidatus Angelobacter sp.]